MSLLLIGFVLRISRHWNYVSRKFEFGLVLPQSISSKFQNSFTAEFWRTFWLRTSASTIALKFLWRTCYINKSWYQKFQAKTLAKCFTKCNFLQTWGPIKGWFHKKYSTAVKSDYFPLLPNDSCSSSQVLLPPRSNRKLYGKNFAIAELYG